MTYPVSVRTIAEFALEGGDLMMEAASAERMREGLEGHILLQRQLDATWRTEESLSREVEIGGVGLRVQGRADAVRRLSGALTVEEIKTTGHEPASIGEDDYPAHWAQAQIYAAILCQREGFAFAEVALLYYNLGGTRARFSRFYSAEELEGLFFGYAEKYANWMAALEVWRGKFQPSVRALKFPFDTYRDGQRQMARNAYIAVRDKKRVMIEAPTGIGKTAAALFGALKASGEGLATAVFYLTARTTGRRAAEDAIELMRGRGLFARAVTITAKEKACIPGDVDCANCPYAHGYFDRQRAALVQALDVQKLDQAAIRELAEEYTLCPFEFSLGLTESADVIISDYHYAFDPRNRLQRFFLKKNDCALLVDEAHNLPERARDMLSAPLSGREIARLRREVGKADVFYPALTKAAKAFRWTEDMEPEAASRPDDKLAAAADDLYQALYESVPRGHPHGKQLVRLMLDAMWYCRRHGEFDEKESRALKAPDGKYLDAKIMCVNPAAHIGKCLSRVGGAVLFSATLTPADFYARELAVDEKNGDARLSLPSPFPPENQLTLLMELPTRFRAREQTLSEVARAIYAMAAGKVGNYLACFPSHAYLGMAFERFREMYPDVRAVRQGGRMSESERAAFIAAFEPAPDRSMVAFIALGGVFAEGVDLPGERLVGAAIVSVAIPQICQEREVIREIMDDGEDGGYDFAYTYPGFRRVLQAAGRVIRTESDRGVVLLIDERFGQEKYIALMPPHWRVSRVEGAEGVGRAVGHFWKTTES